MLGGLFLIALLQTVSQAAELRFTSPTKVLSSAETVLGDEDNSGKNEEDKSDEKNEDEKKEENKSNEEQKKAEEQKKEDEKKVEEQKKESSNSFFSNFVKSRTVTPTKSPKVQIQSEGDKTETEIETSDGQKVKTKTEDDGTTKIEIEHGELKIKYKVVNGEVTKTVEDEDGNEVELEDTEVAELEDELDNELEDEGIEISTRSGKPSFVRNRVAATTQFPLSIDVGTNQLIVTTPAGSKAVAVLPDEAVQALLATKVVDQITSTPDTQTPTGSGSANTVVELRVIDNEPVYEVKGTKEYKLFAFIPVTQPVTAVVSAETGQVVGTQRSLVTNLVDLLSP